MLKRYSGVWTTKRHVYKEASAKFSQGWIRGSRLGVGVRVCTRGQGVISMGGYPSNPRFPKDNKITDVS
jgi:hypothetical protein